MKRYIVAAVFVSLLTGLLATAGRIAWAQYTVRGLADDDKTAFWDWSIVEEVNRNEVQLRYVLNDAGAMHSGMHCVWIIWRRSIFQPWKELVRGWHEKRTMSEAVVWRSDAEFVIDLFETKRSDDVTRFEVNISNATPLAQKKRRR